MLINWLIDLAVLLYFSVVICLFCDQILETVILLRALLYSTVSGE